MEYTKGPWTWEDDKLVDAEGVPVIDIFKHFDHSSCRIVARLMVNPNGNQTLIQACPEMYEACLSALGVLNRDPSEIPKMIDSVRGQILQALSKAEGKED